MYYQYEKSLETYLMIFVYIYIYIKNFEYGKIAGINEWNGKVTSLRKLVFHS